MNTLYYGDNLEILRKYVPDESVDLIYLDPPFNSKRAYNVLFHDKTGADSAAQIQAFEDTWTWTPETQSAFDEIMTGRYPAQLQNMMRAFREFMDINNLMAYLTMMAIRLVELHRVLKKTGSIYLHCDPTASHYLKVLMDQIFGITNFRNEISWKRTPFAGSSKIRAQQYPRVHDVLLFYGASADIKFECPVLEYSEEYFKRFKDEDERGRYQKVLLKTYSDETLQRLREENRIIEPKKKGAGLRYKLYISDLKGRQIEDTWFDINMINSMAKERLGYPTQKPVELLERIIQASSHEGDIVLDPFCGCGTAIVAAEKLGRKWIGIDITHLAIALIKKRMADHFADAKFEIIGEPKSVYDAERLFEQSAFQFEAWAVSLIGGQPFKSKGGGDKGIDGFIFFPDTSSNFQKIIVSVKGGGYQPKDIRELKTVMQRDKAPMGIIIALRPPTKGMKEEIAGMGKWKMPGVDLEFPVMQIITIQELFDGKKPDIPQWHETLKRATREKREREKTLKLL